MDIIFWSSNIGMLRVISRYVGPYKLKHWIKKFGFESKVIDFLEFLTEEEIYQATRRFITPKTLAIGISTTFLTNRFHKWQNGGSWPMPEHVFLALKRLKKEYPYLKIILGGYGSEQLYLPNIIDASIMSYTEATEDILVEYLNYLKFGTPPPKGKLIDKFYNLTDINYQKLKPKPRPHFDQANIKKYNIEQDDFRFELDDNILVGESLPMDISRGCIFACRFCKYPHLGKNKLDYIRGMEYVKQEMISNYEKFQTTNYMILDDTFNETEIKLDAFLKMTETLPFKIEYSAYLRADLIHRFPNTAYLLKESGLWGAFHGLESLHPYASNIVGKAWSGKHARDYIPKLYHDIWAGQIPMHLNFILGLPKSDTDDMLATINWFEQNNLYNIGIDKMVLVNPEYMGRYSILSEFDRNSTKWGFKFFTNEEIKEANIDAKIAWTNETWDPAKLSASYTMLQSYLKSKKLEKCTVWSLGNMQLMGYDKEFLVSTPRVNYDENLFSSRKKQTYNTYYNLLMQS